MDENPTNVAQFGREFVAGYRAGGVSTCGKHFPSYGNLQFDHSGANIPCVHDTPEELRRSAFIPFQTAIKEGVDSIMVGACATPNIKGSDVQHAYLSNTIVNDFLRQDLQFRGVVLSECLEVESLHENVGFGQAAIMALSAGCDMLMVCNSFTNQLETLGGIHMALESGVLSKSRLENSLARVLKMKRYCTSWDTVLKSEADGLSEMASMHHTLAQSAYESSITVVRDSQSILPLRPAVDRNQQLVLLSPLLEPLSTRDSDLLIDAQRPLMEGELTFRKFGMLLSRYWQGEVKHTSYAPSAVRQYHEDLVASAQIVIVLTADSSRNPYQYGFTKYIGMLCASDTAKPKQLIVVATSSPYDLLDERQIQTYICTYDYTYVALSSLAKVLFGQIRPSGIPPGDSSSAGTNIHATATKLPSVWLTQKLDVTRDMNDIVALLLKSKSTWPLLGDMTKDDAEQMVQEMGNSKDLTIFAVKNTSTQVVYGVCVACYIPCISRGSIAMLLVDPGRRCLGIGQSLHKRAISHIQQQHNPHDIQLGSDFPGLIPGLSRGVEKDREADSLKHWILSR